MPLGHCSLPAPCGESRCVDGTLSPASSGHASPHLAATERGDLPADGGRARRRHDDRVVVDVRDLDDAQRRAAARPTRAPSAAGTAGRRRAGPRGARRNVAGTASAAQGRQQRLAAEQLALVARHRLQAGRGPVGAVGRLEVVVEVRAQVLAPVPGEGRVRLPERAVGGRRRGRSWPGAARPGRAPPPWRRRGRRRPAGPAAARRRRGRASARDRGGGARGRRRRTRPSSARRRRRRQPRGAGRGRRRRRRDGPSRTGRAGRWTGRGRAGPARRPGPRAARARPSPRPGAWR